ncbi:MAG TPA: hypothetical protein VHE23_01530 [Candidatus Acidoferrales bacterium]|nr:hypothetical protein [Candidatus Acidoferrales bacterium]
MEPLSPEQLLALRSGRVPRERKLAVCAGTLHLDPPDRAEILAVFASDGDEMVAEHAKDALLSQPIDSFVAAIKREKALPALFHYCARNLADKPGIGDALVENKSCPAEELLHVVRHLSVPGIQALLEELDRVSASPGLAALLEQSSSVTIEQKKLLKELHGPAMDHAALVEALAVVEPDHARRESLLLKLSKMTVSQRVQLALKGSSEERSSLIRDASRVVQRAVLQSPRLTDREVEAFAAMSSMSDEVLRVIASNRNFRKNYAVIHNLMNNPKTPLDVTLHMLPLLNPQDLKMLTLNKNIPETLRTTALKLLRQRKEGRQNN